MIALFLSMPSGARAQDWTRSMFDQMDHDFGTVARGAKCEHRFLVTNAFKEDAHIESAHASCGCTTPEVPVEVIKTWQKAYVVAKVDTTNFQGQKDVTITVVFDKPFRAEAQLQIHCYIRSDVVVQPGSVQFGSVPQGTAVQQRVAVSYAGRPNWKILGVECATPGVTGRAVETGRHAASGGGAGRVDYDLTVDLAANVAPGYIRNQLFLLTNDPNPRATRVPVIVEGVVLSPVSIHPSPLYMGTVDVNNTVTRQFIVRGDLPFKITKVVSSNPGFKCEVPQDSAKLLRLPVTFTGADVPGKASGTIRIETTAAGGPLEADVSVDIMAPTADPSVTGSSPSGPATTGPSPAGSSAKGTEGSGNSTSGGASNESGSSTASDKVSLKLSSILPLDLHLNRTAYGLASAIAFLSFAIGLCRRFLSVPWRS
jgi:hypothetical protein